MLVAAQMAFALVVLAASGLLLRSFQRLHAVRPGFNADGVATLWVALPGLRYPIPQVSCEFYAAARRPRCATAWCHCRRHHVATSAREQWRRIGIRSRSRATSRRTANVPPLEMYSDVDAGYFTAMGIPLIAGRAFDRIDRQHGDEAIISSETSIRFFHDSTGRAAIGKRFRELPAGEWITVIGVVGGVRDTTLSASPTRAVYYPESVTTDTVFRWSAVYDGARRAHER